MCKAGRTSTLAGQNGRHNGTTRWAQWNLAEFANTGQMLIGFYISKIPQLQVIPVEFCGLPVLLFNTGAGLRCQGDTPASAASRLPQQSTLAPQRPRGGAGDSQRSNCIQQGQWQTRTASLSRPNRSLPTRNYSIEFGP
jgi:hypothetical protein